MNTPFKKISANDWIAIIDLGSPYSQQIAKKVRALNVYSEILPYNNLNLDKIQEHSPKGIILSGIYDNYLQNKNIIIDQKLFSMSIPVLALGYSIDHLLKIKRENALLSDVSKIGNTSFNNSNQNENKLFYQIPDNFKILVDEIKINERDIPIGFEAITFKDNKSVFAFQDINKRLYGIQFHPKTVNSEYGEDILYNFVYKICNCSPDWTNRAFIDSSVKAIKEEIKDGHVVAGVSGGIDSLVAALLTYKAVGKQLHCIFIDTGLMRKNEVEEIKQVFDKNFSMDLKIYDYSDPFVKALSGVIDPERKRKIIGNLFVKVFEEKAKNIGNVTHLLQGTVYPDVIESATLFDLSPKVKSHHNVGGLPEKMNLKLLEPLRNLFKDEVREVGRILGLSEKIIWRQPFPGPGLAIRIIGEVNNNNLAVLKEADEIIRIEIEKEEFYQELWQYFGVLLPIKSVGVTNGQRTYENTLVLRIVSSEDGMTANWVKIPYHILNRISTLITKKVHGINRVLYDISSKPPATIEWE